MENDSRNARIKEMTDAINKLYAEGTSTEYDFDDDSVNSGLSESQINKPRTERVATSMRSQRASRVQSVDMSGIDATARTASRRTSGASRSQGSTRTSGNSRTQSTSRTSDSGSSRTPRTSTGTRSGSSSVSSAKRPVSSSTKASQSRRTSRPVAADKAAAIEQTASTEPVRAYSEVLEEKKRSRRSAAPSGKKQSKKKKGLSGFKKFLIIYSAILIVVIIVTAIILSSFLKNFEKNQPTNVASYVVSQFDSPEKLRSFLDENASITNRSTAILNYEDAFIEAVSGKKISFIEDPSNTTSEVTCYKLTADSMPVASITLSKGEKGAFGLSSWVLSAIDTTSAFTDVKTYSILVPEGSKVIVNDSELSDSMISGTGIPEVLQTSSQFIKDPPTYTTYNVKVVADSINVTGTDPTGANLVFSQTENSFVAGGQASAEFIESVQDRVEAGLREYALYFIYNAFDLDSYIIDGCELHAFIFGGKFGDEEYDPINPWLYNFEYIDDFSFSTFEAKNYTRYSDDCFTVDINYKLDITFTDPSYSDNNQKLDATWVWIRQGDQWYISSSKTH